MSDSRKYSLLIPEKVLNEWEAITELIKPSISGFMADNLAEIVSIVARHYRGEPTPLKAVYLRRMVPQGDKYLQGLIDLGIVERSGQTGR